MDKDKLLNAKCKKVVKESKDCYVLYWDAEELYLNSCHCNIYPANLCYG